MELQDKIIRFGKILAEADAMNRRILNRFAMRGQVDLWCDAEFRKIVWRHFFFRQDLFRMEMSAELAHLVAKGLTREERKSPYAAITLARFSMPALAHYTLEQLQLTPDELDAMESILKKRAEMLLAPSLQKLLVIALALLSWFCSDIPDEVLTAWNVDKAQFIPLAFYIGISGVAFSLLLFALQVAMMSRVGRQDELTQELIVYCRAELLAGGARKTAAAEAKA